MIDEFCESLSACEVVVPWRPGCPHRARAWRWVQGRIRATGWPVVTARAADSVAWCKAAAINPWIEASRADIIVLSDADVWTDGLAGAVAAVCQGAAWAIPHREVHRLSEAGTEALLAGGDWSEMPLDEQPRQGVTGGGILVARRETLVDIPMDVRFIGWGQEDLSHGAALATLAGEPWRGSADLLHLWHPPQARLTRKHGSEHNWGLWRRYAAALNDPVSMRALIEEGQSVDRATA